MRKWGTGRGWLVEESSWPHQGLLAHPRAQMSYWSCGSSRGGEPHLSLLSPVSPPMGWMCPSYPNSAETWGLMKMLQTDFFLAIYVLFYNLWGQKLQETTGSQKSLQLLCTCKDLVGICLQDRGRRCMTEFSRPCSQDHTQPLNTASLWTILLHGQI